MDDFHIKELVEQYKRKEVDLNQIEIYLSNIIYRFPYFEFNVKDPDIQGEFYLYFYDRLHKVLESYQERENVKFITYCYFVLKRHYINFIKTQKSLNTVGFIDEMTDTGIKQYVDEDTEQTLDLFLAQVQRILNPKEILFLKLFVPETLNRDDIVVLAQELNVPMIEAIKQLVVLLESVSHREDKKHKVIVIAPVKSVAQFLGIAPQKVSKKLSLLKNKMKGVSDNIYELFN